MHNHKNNDKQNNTIKKYDKPKGYHGAGLRILNDARATVGDIVTITSSSKDSTAHTGIIMPRYEHAADDAHIVIKLKSGYNVGINTNTIKDITVVTESAKKEHDDARNDKKELLSNFDDKQQTRILLLSTGGTIASRIDYRTGAVTPVLSAEELQKTVPELVDIATIDAKVVLSEYSENIMPEHWKLLAQEIVKHAGYDDEMKKDDSIANTITTTSSNDKKKHTQQYDGIIIAHGTDTMHYTSAFLSFALAEFPIPIVLVGAQRSSDRASSDAATNLIGAARFIASHRGENRVYIAMHKESGDDAIACHIGTRVRKNHTSKRNAFQTIGAEPTFVISTNGDIKTAESINEIKTHVDENSNNTTEQDKKNTRYIPKIFLEQKVALVKYHPGYDSNILNHIIDSKYKAIIFEGTGLGHVGKTLYKQIERAAQNGIFLGMTSQCIEGRVRMTVYESGRDLMNLGVVPLYDMIPEVALVKAMWAAGHANNADEIKRIMLQNIALEVTEH